MEMKVMDMKNSKTVLQVAGIIDFVFGIPGVLLGVLGIVGAVALTNVPDISEEAAGLGAAIMGGGSALIILASLLAVVEGIITFRAVKDPMKIMPVWVLAVISLGLSVVGISVSLFGGICGLSDVISLALNGFVFYAANSVKVTVGK